MLMESESTSQADMVPPVEQQQSLAGNRLNRRVTLTACDARPSRAMTCGVIGRKIIDAPR